MKQTQQNLFDYLEIVYRRKWMIIIPIIIGISFGKIISYSFPNAVYRSTTLIIVEQQQVPESYVRSTDITSIERRLSTINQQIMSRSNLENIIHDNNLYQNDKLQISLNPLIWIGFKKTTSLTKEEIVEQMRNDIEVKILDRRDGAGAAFSISYTGSDPVVTMKVTNAIASLYIEGNLKIREQYAEGTAEFLASELEKAKEELEKQENAVRTFREVSMGKLPEQLDSNLRTLDRLQIELQSINSSLRTAEDRKSTLEEQLNLLKNQTTYQPILPSPLQVELDNLKRELGTLLSVYKENYPDVLITKNRIRDLEELTANERDKDKKTKNNTAIQSNPRIIEINSNLSAVDYEITSLKEREVYIRKEMNKFEKRVEGTPASEQKVINLRRDYDISLRNYQALLEKKLSARLAENLEKRQKSERFRILDSANLPEKPYKQNRLKIILIGAMLGAGISLCLVFLLEFLNPAFRKPEDITQALNQQVLAIIPVFSNKTIVRTEKKLKVLKGNKEA